MPTIDRFDDAVGIGGPDEWVRLAVVLACGAPGLETPCVALKEGFMREGVAGLLREKPESQAYGLRHQKWVGPGRRTEAE
jgi:hypothetical protein